MELFLSALAYVVIVFPLAIGWHLGLFKARYAKCGYFDDEPNVLLGFSAIIIQGAVLALIYPYFKPGSTGLVRAFTFAGLVGLFFWTSHVLSFVARNARAKLGGFTVMESCYLVLQFGLFALALGMIYPESA